MSIILTKGAVGYTDDTQGYSGAFSWWRNTEKPQFWSVVCHENGFGVDYCHAVTDDFGNLVKVKS